LVIDLRRLEEAPAQIRGEIAADDPLWQEAGLELVTPLLVQATAEGSWARGVRVRGSMLASIRACCRRCLGTLELEVAESFDIFFDPNTSPGDEDVGLYALDSGAEELYLSGPLRERFVLAVPAFPLCREDCLGLCPRCGADLNECECSCRVAEADPRWGPLEALRSDG
jgi:uncharacterized protein